MYLSRNGIKKSNKIKGLKFLLTPATHMEVGCPGTCSWGLELPTPTQVARAPQKPALPATSHVPRQPYPTPAQAPVTQSQKLCGSNDNSNNQY